MLAATSSSAALGRPADAAGRPEAHQVAPACVASQLGRAILTAPCCRLLRGGLCRSLADGWQPRDLRIAAEMSSRPQAAVSNRRASCSVPIYLGSLMSLATVIAVAC